MDDETERESLERERVNLVRQIETLEQRADALTTPVTETLVTIQARLREIDRRLFELSGGEAPHDDI